MSYQTKYHKTGQFRNAVRHLHNSLSYNGVDETGKVLTKPIENPIVKYVGTVKLHGTHASLVLHEDGSVTFHSKEQYLATLTPENEFEFGRDNAEFAQTMSRRKDALRFVLDNIVCILDDNDLLEYPIKVSGEWCGQGVQKGVGISFIDKKSFFVFGVKAGDNWVHPVIFNSVFDTAAGIYNICNFKTFEIDVDVTFPDKASSKIEELVLSVEEECPVSKQLGVKEYLVGEGIVWAPADNKLFSDTGTWFKTKGQKHSTSKVKKIASVDPEKVKSIEKFIEYAVTENRLNQGLENVELDVKNTGKFIGWVNRDINDEEGDVLEQSNLTMKEVGKHISNKAREFFMSKL